MYKPGMWQLAWQQTKRLPYPSQGLIIFTTADIIYGVYLPFEIPYSV